MKTNLKGIEIIKASESKHNNAYKCPAGIPTIGWGHTKSVRMGDYASDATCVNFLLEDLEDAEYMINSLNLNLNQNQFSALVSLVFNIGIGNFKKSTVLKKIKLNHSDPLIAIEFAKWRRGGGKVLQGLVIRRKKEIDLYFS
jgi:lysozyme